MKENKYYCVICNKKQTRFHTDLGNFNSVICEKCKDKKEAREEMGYE